MERGKIISYSPQNDLGFIQSAAGQSLTFTKRSLVDVADEPKMIVGACVEFVSAKKGDEHHATYVVFQKMHSIKTLPKLKITHQEDLPYGYIEAATRIETDFFPALDEAKSEIKTIAQSLGANAVYDLKVEKEIDRQDNYVFSIYRITATVGIVSVTALTGDQRESVKAERYIKENVEAFTALLQQRNTKPDPIKQQQNMESMVGVICGVGALLLLLASCA